MGDQDQANEIAGPAEPRADSDRTGEDHIARWFPEFLQLVKRVAGLLFVFTTVGVSVLGVVASLIPFDGGGNAAPPPSTSSTSTPSSSSTSTPSSSSTSTPPSVPASYLVDYDSDGEIDFVVFDQWGPQQIERTDTRGAAYAALGALGAALIGAFGLVLAGRGKNDVTKLEQRMDRFEQRFERLEGT